VHAAIHLDHEPRLGRGKVHDEPPDDHLPTERDAQEPAAERSPDALFRRRLMKAM
jgi:hypothetical protein